MTFTNFVEKYWAQIALLLGIIGYIIKIFLDYRIRNKELRNKYFYELKAQKIIDLYSKVVEIQMTIDRHVGGDRFGSNIFKHRIDLDKFYWESALYFRPKTQKMFKLFLNNLKYFESKELIDENPEIENNFEIIITLMLKEFKNELL